MSIQSSEFSEGQKPDRWLSRKEAAAFLTSINCPVTPQTLAMYAANDGRRGPPYMKILDRAVRYKEQDLRDWAAKHTRRIS